MLSPEHPAKLRRAVVYALGHLRAVEAGPTLTRLLDDSDADVRLALLHVTPEVFAGSLAALTPLIDDPDPAVSHAAQQTLGRTARPRSTPGEPPDAPTHRTVR